MYAKFFGFRENPFTITPDPRYLYMSRQHQDALAHLLYGTGEEGGFVQLTGEVGTGKTTLVRALLEQHLPEVELALVLNPRQTIVEFVATICDELGVAYPPHCRTLKPVLDALNRHLLATHTEGRQTVLVVDEAQNLSLQVLEQVRLLTNLETTRHKLLRIILVGQPELNVLLERHDMRQLAQRITARCHLGPLSEAETADYIIHRLAVVGGDPETFTAAAKREVYRSSGGIPRLINVVCDRSLLGAYVGGERTVSRAIVRQAAVEALGRPRPRALWRLVTAGALLVTGAAAAGVYHFWPLSFPGPRSLEHAAATDSGASGDTPNVVVEALDDKEPVAPEVRPAQAETSAVGAELAAATISQYTAPSASSTTESPDIETLDDDPREPIVPRPGPFSTALSRSDAEEVHRALLQLWQVAPTPAALGSPCEALVERAMRCLQGTMSWQQLMAWNRPAVLMLSDDGGNTHPLLLQGVEAEQATVNWGRGPRSVPVAALQDRWSGEATVLWRLPTSVSLIGRGSMGAPVRWLRQQLAMFDGQSPASAGEAFDVELEDRVRRFQAQHGLQVDGIVGQWTMLRLSNFGPAGNEPRLLQEPQEG